MLDGRPPFGRSPGRGNVRGTMIPLSGAQEEDVYLTLGGGWHHQHSSGRSVPSAAFPQQGQDGLDPSVNRGFLGQIELVK